MAIAAVTGLRDNESGGASHERQESTDAAADCIRGSLGRSSGGPMGLPRGASGEQGIGRSASCTRRRSCSDRRYSDLAARPDYRGLPAGLILDLVKILAPASGAVSLFGRRRASLELIVLSDGSNSGCARSNRERSRTGE